ncbi:copper transporter [Hysterangium stoloniferum]|nr:copper transporter [Hysterangium stoloniferum]
MDHGDSHIEMAKCSMNMLWNTQIADTCIVFRGWHITSNVSFFLSCLAIVGLGVAYEYLRVFQRRVDVKIARSLRAGSNGGGAVSVPPPDEQDSLLTTRVKSRNVVAVPCAARLYRAFLYGAAVFLSFFLMLVFMTYNAYLILSVVIGAALGHYIFAGQMDPEAVLINLGEGKGMSCH